MIQIKKTILTLVALLAVTTGAYAASVSYVDGNGTSQTVDATELESTTTSWTDGSWYIVPEGGLTISGRIAVSGTVNLILRDGTELTASAGITTTNATLNIYAQSAGTGALTATGASGASKIGGSAGIGGIGVGVSASGGAGGTVNIYGGTVTATGGKGGLGGGGGAGIGGGGLGWTSNAGSGAGGTVNIYGGTVTATGGTGGNYGGGGAGIGGGGNGYNAGTPADGTVNIYGGTVTATGGTGGTGGGVGAGIGGGGNGYNSSAGAGGTLTLGVGAKLYNGTDNTGTVLDGNDSESRNYSGSRPKNMFAEGTVAASASSGPEVSGPTIVEGKPQWTFSMPGGNVTLEPEYYPQAALAAAPTAINDVPATTDGAIVEAGTVANIGETTTAQGTVMYYVSPSALDDAALLALTADQWTADVPTAADLAQGQAYVYYYVRGNDGDTDDEIFSDGDILATNALPVTLGAAPLWNAEFDLTDAPEEDKAGKWSTDIPEGGVVKGQTVNVTYSGTKKVIGVKAEKVAAPAAAEGHALSASVVGEIVGTDGKAYAVADKDNLPEGVTAVAMVAYKSATTGKSLAIALADEGSMNWNSAKSTCASKAAIGGKSWKLPTMDEWKQMFSANGGNEGSYSGLNSAITTAGGTALDNHNSSDFYWSSSEGGEYESAWYVRLASGGTSWSSLPENKEDPAYVRAVLAF